MSLDWQLPAPKVISSPHAHDLIWFTMLAQIGHLTTSNLPEFTRRLKLWQANVDNFEIPPEILPEFIGMRTNVSETKKSAWNAYFLKVLERRLMK